MPPRLAASILDAPPRIDDTTARTIGAVYDEGRPPRTLFLGVDFVEILSNVETRP